MAGAKRNLTVLARNGFLQMNRHDMAAPRLEVFDRIPMIEQGRIGDIARIRIDAKIR